jgi:two-component sensor histidine kinase
MAVELTSRAAHQPDLSSLCLAITEHAPLPMATVEGASHIVRYVNPAFCRLMDKPAEQLVGKPFAEMLPEKDVSVTLLDRVFRTGKPESHTEQQHSKPHSVFWTYTMWPVLADELPVGIMIQVTETAQFHEKTLAMNEALMLGSLRQHELTEAANASNVQLQTEITERVRLEREHAIAGERIGVLLQELTHRIKNSLQIIVSMVSLEARNQKSGEGKAALERVSHRIAALGRLYSMLGETNSVEEVDAASYLEALCRDLIESVQKENGTSIALKTDIASEQMPVDRAIPLGLIVNELVTNAVKYAFPDEPKGTVAVTLKRFAGELRLIVSDDGKGVDPRREDSGFGGRLVDSFARQLGGQVERESSNKGTIVCLILPSREAS